jgi:prepilin-type N-terminal cleavage/methylation domain-containing protein/prepilin-type processing-associated H-X9-DG protein
MLKGRRRIGFTLIELLVVVAIIVILAAILFPIFAAAREKARTISCVSNTNQIAKAVIVYMSDNDDRMVPMRFVSDTEIRWPRSSLDKPPDGYGWVYIKNLSVWYCPSDRRKPGTYGYSYFLNGFTQMMLPTFWDAGNSPGWPGLEGHGTPARMSWFRSISTTVVWVEEALPAEIPGVGAGDIDWLFCCRDYMSARHRGRGTLSFLDGHATTMISWTTSKDPNQNWKSRWATAVFPGTDEFLFAGGYHTYEGPWGAKYNPVLGNPNHAHCGDE